MTDWSLTGNSVGTNDFLGTTNNQPLVIKANNQEAVCIDLEGNVGIRTSQPDAPLHVTSGAEFIIDKFTNRHRFRVPQIHITGTNRFGGPAALRLTNGDTAYAPPYRSPRKPGTSWDITVDGHMHFSTPQNNVGDVMTLTDEGKAGIGTTSPDAKLQVSSGDDSLDSPQVHITQTTEGAFARLRFSTPEEGEIAVRFWDIAVGDWNQSLYLYNGLEGNVMQLTSAGDVTIVGSIHAGGDITSKGVKPFVQDHPTDPTREIVYVSLEGGEVGTYMRGTWKLEDGKALIELPEHFSLVTSEDGLTVQLTPRGEWLQLYIVRLNTRQIVVQEAQGKSGQFDYLVQGIRKGYEHHEVVRQKTTLPE